MKNLFLTSLTLIFFFGSALTTFAFTDVDDSHPYRESISDFKNEGKIQGYQDGTFKPGATISRGEFLKVLFEAKPNLEAEEEKTNCFPDVADEWFAKYVCTAKEKGIVNGAGDGLFYPNDQIIFAEAAKIMFETSNNSNYSFFSEEADPWYKEYVNALSHEKIIAPTVTDIDHKVTRGEMVEMAWRDEYKSTYHRNYDSYKRSTVFSFRYDGTHFTMIDLGHPYLWTVDSVWYGGIKMPEADFESFIQLEGEYARDKNMLYYKHIPLEGVDLETFEHTGESKTTIWSNPFIYIRDKNSIYVIDTEISHLGKIRGVDTRTFEILERGYAKDATSVFYKNEKIEGVNPKNFSLLSIGNDEGEHARETQHYYTDGQKIYLSGKVLEGLDSTTFENVCRNIIRDKDTVYQITEGGVTLLTTDSEHFECFGWPWTYLKDQENVWYFDEEIIKIPDADASSFEAFGTYFSHYLSQEVSYHSARDKNSGYFIGQKVEGVDGKTFQHWRDYITYDKNGVYFQDEKIDFIERDSFDPLQYSYLKDKDNVYYYDHYYHEFATKNPLVIAKEADTTTFEALQFEYGRDKYSGFYEGKKIPESDGKTFEVVDTQHSKDKNHVYKYREILEGVDPETFATESGSTSDTKDNEFVMSNSSDSGLCVGFIGIQTDLDSSIYSQGDQTGPLNSLEIMKDGERNILIYKLEDIDQELASHGLTEPTFLAERSGWVVYERRNRFTGTLQLIVDGPRDFKLGVSNKLDPDVETVMRQFVDSAYIDNKCPVTPFESTIQNEGNTLCYDRLHVQTDLPLSEYSYMNPENLSVVLKDDKEHFIIYPLIPGIDVTEDYDLETVEFTVEKMGWTVYKDDGRTGGYIVDSPILPFLIFPVDESISDEVVPDIEMFLKGASFRFDCPEDSGEKEISDE